MEQPAIVKPSTSGKPGKQEKEKKKLKSMASKMVENDSSDASESCEHLDEDFIVAQEIQSMIEIIEIVHQMASCVEASEKKGSYSAVAELNAQVAAVIDVMIIIIEGNAPSMSFYSKNRPLSSGLSVSLVLESILQSVEIGGAVKKAARIRHEGPIIDLRSLPWELKAAAEISSATTLPSESRLSQLWSESPANLRNDLREGRMNSASSASTQHTNAVQNALSAVVVPPLNLEIAQTLRRKQDQRF